MVPLHPQVPAVRPNAYRVVALNEARLQRILAQAPLELQASSGAELVLFLPMPDETFLRFRVEESPILSPMLAAQHPEIKTYVAQGIDDRTMTARLDLTPAGFHAIVFSVRGTVFVDPYQRGDTAHYISYWKSDVPQSSPFMCGRTKDPVTGVDAAPRQAPTDLAPSGANLRTYRLAVSATGEYTAFFRQPGDSDAQAQARALGQITTTVNRTTGIYEREVAIRLNLAATRIFVDAATDPFANGANVDGTLLNENQAELDANVGTANYDIGHVVSQGGGGGLAGLGVACNGATKGRGGTSLDNPSGDAFDVDFFAHEVGHQFGGNHTFNGTTGSCGGGNRNAATAYEPGSGTTIMAYAGICGAEDVQPHSDDYFHTISFDEITNYRDGGGSCGAQTTTGNTAPNVQAGLDYTIPTDTPFVLTATGSDPDGDALTFNWEQLDLGAASPPPNNADGPLFRSRGPTVDPSRTFPRLQDILSGAATPWEILPTVNRTLNFRTIARDNRAGGGGVNYDSMTITVAGDPFRVTSPNGGEHLGCGCQVPVTWIVGGGNVAPTVDIEISLDGGNNFTTLLTGTPNDGAANVTVPCGASASARLRIRAVGNIFFDVSNADFALQSVPPSITPSITGGAVDASCTLVVPFQATVTDDCRVDAATIATNVSLLTANATLGSPSVNIVQNNDQTATVTGSVVVSGLTGSPATVRLGVHAADACGNPTDNAAVAQVVDTTPPTISFSVTPTVLWPPNHKLVTITASVTVADNCSPTSFVLSSITSNEPDEGLGDGDTGNDIQGAELGTADTTFKLRAERSGNGNGRVYTIKYTATDASGNPSDAVATVHVPKS